MDFKGAWEGAKRVDNWLDPFDVAAAGAANTIEFLIPQTKEELALELVTLGQGKKLALGGKLARIAGNKAYDAAKSLFIKPPNNPPTALATVATDLGAVIKQVSPGPKNGASHVVENGAKNGLENGAKPLQIAGNMQASNWQGSIKTLLKEGAPTEQIVRTLRKPWHSKLAATYQYMSIDDLAKDKGGWLTRLVERADDYSQGLVDWRKAKSQGASNTKLGNMQRKGYDKLGENPLDAFKQIYDPNNPIRKLLAETFNTVMGKEWHHIFGNKDAAEFMLAQVSQDPYIAVNLMHHLSRLKLSTAGVPDNIALMSKTPHRGAGGYHSYSKRMGFESTGKKKGDLELSDFGTAISESILSGKTDVNELFTILTKYSQLNQHQRQILKSEYGAQILSESGPIMKFIQSVSAKDQLKKLKDMSIE